MKNLLNLGKALNKAEQKKVFGGSKKHPSLADCSQNTTCDANDPEASSCGTGSCNGMGAVWVGGPNSGQWYWTQGFCEC